MNILFTPHQDVVFLYMILIGAVTGVFYDLFKAKRLLFGSHAITLFIEDLLFCLGSAVIFLFSVFVLNRGVVRWYQFTAMVIGFILYRFSVSFLVMKIILLLSYFLSIALYPIKFLIYKLNFLINKLYYIVYRKKQKKKVFSFIYNLREI